MNERTMPVWLRTSGIFWLSFLGFLAGYGIGWLVTWIWP